MAATFSTVTSVPVMVGLPARPGNMAWFRLPSE